MLLDPERPLDSGDADDSAVAQLGRDRGRGAPGSAEHYVGARGIWSPTGEYLLIE